MNLKTYSLSVPKHNYVNRHAGKLKEEVPTKLHIRISCNAKQMTNNINVYFKFDTFLFKTHFKNTQNTKCFHAHINYNLYKYAVLQLSNKFQ